MNTEKFVLSYIKCGFGNKVYFTSTLIYFFREIQKRDPKFTKLYIVIEKSKHDIKENFVDFFPEFSKLKYLEFIDWVQYDKLKKESNFILQSNITKIKDIPLKKSITLDLEYYFSDYPIRKDYKFFKKLYKIKHSPLEHRYDYNGIFLHIRYGDKLEINQACKVPKYIVLEPDFYIKAIDYLQADHPDRKVYIFTDSPKIVEEKILPYLKNATLTNEPYWNVWYLCQKFKHLVLSDSTLVFSASIFNEVFENVVAFKYTILSFNENVAWPEKMKNFRKYKKMNLVQANRPYNILVDNFSYLMY
jgi:hypothetical protein